MKIATGLPWLFDGTRKQTLNVAIVFLGTLLGIVIVKASLEDITIIEPIAVPKSIEDSGYTGTIVALRLIDGVAAISESSGTIRERVLVGSASQYAALSSIQLPSAGVSVRSIVSVMRGLFGVVDNRISGEITVRKPATSWFPARYALVLRFEWAGRRTTVEKEADTVEQLVELASRSIVQKIDPYTLAAHFRNKGKGHWDDMNLMVDEMLTSSDPALVKWALVLRASTLAESGKMTEAIDMYTAATILDPEFTLAHYSWGLVLRNTGDYRGAIEKFRTTTDIDPRYEDAHLNWALALIELNNYDAAFARFRRAARIAKNPVVANYYWSLALLESGDAKEAKLRFQRAHSINAAQVSYPNWALAHLNEQEHETALAKVHTAIAIETKDQVFLVADFFRRRMESAGHHAGAIRIIELARIRSQSNFSYVFDEDLRRLLGFRESGPP